MTTMPVSVSRRFASLSEGLSPTYWFLWLGMLINRLGSFVVPMITIYLTRGRHLTLGDASAVVSLFGFGSMLGTTLGGVLADRIGRRVTMLMSLVSGAICMLALGASQALPALAISIFFLGLTGDMFRPAMLAIVADVVEPRFRLKAFGFQYWAINLGFSFAAVIGGTMATRNFTVLFVGDAATTLIFAALVFRFVPETRPAQTEKSRAGSVLTPFLDRRYLTFLVLSWLIAMVFMQHLTVLPMDMQLKGLDPVDFGLAIALNGVLIVLVQPSVVSRIGSRARWALLAISALLVGIGFGLTTFATTLPLYFASVVVWTIGEIVMSPVNSTIVADLAPPELRGRYQGAMSLTWSLAAMAGPLVSPPIIEATSMRTFWFCCFGAGLVAAAGHVIFGRRALMGAHTQAPAPTS